MMAAKAKPAAQDKYVVIRSFLDANDGARLYQQGAPYPVAGKKPTESRIAELVAKGFIQKQ